MTGINGEINFLHVKRWKMSTCKGFIASLRAGCIFYRTFSRELLFLKSWFPLERWKCFSVRKYTVSRFAFPYTGEFGLCTVLMRWRFGDGRTGSWLATDTGFRLFTVDPVPFEKTSIRRRRRIANANSGRNRPDRRRGRRGFNAAAHKLSPARAWCLEGGGRRSRVREIRKCVLNALHYALTVYL